MPFPNLTAIDPSLNSFKLFNLPKNSNEDSEMLLYCNPSIIPSARIPNVSNGPLSSIDPVAEPPDKESVQKLLIKKDDASVNIKSRSRNFS